MPLLAVASFTLVGASSLVEMCCLSKQFSSQMCDETNVHTLSEKLEPARGKFCYQGRNHLSVPTVMIDLYRKKIRDVTKPTSNNCHLPGVT